MTKIKLYNQLNFEKGISNSRIFESDIVKKNYGENSIIIRIIDIKDELIKEICFPKGKNQKLFKIVNGYTKNNKQKRENIYNLGIISSQVFHVWNYDLNTGVFLGRKVEHYANLVNLLAEHCSSNLLKESKMNGVDKTPIEMCEIREQKKAYLENLKNLIANDYNERESSSFSTANITTELKKPIKKEANRYTVFSDESIEEFLEF